MPREIPRKTPGKSPGKSPCPAPRLTGWAALLIALALSCLWLIGLAGARFLRLF